MCVVHYREPQSQSAQVIRDSMCRCPADEVSCDALENPEGEECSGKKTVPAPYSCFTAINSTSCSVAAYTSLMSSILDRDHLNAFCRHSHAEAQGATQGPLAGLNCGIKDIYDIAGFRTGWGSPEWLADHPPAAITATVVQQLLDAGAAIVGKTQTDELTFSLAGENAHYGTPVNPAAPGRIPGGSSSGSAAATAGGLVDFALGSDTGGSVRGPAALCGVFGMRPTHGRISLAGACAFAPSMDTAGWFARDPALLETIGTVLLGPEPARSPFTRVLIAEDAFAELEPEAAPTLKAARKDLLAHFATVASVRLSPAGLGDWLDVFRPLQGAEIWAGLGPWVTAHQPKLGPGIAERFAWAAGLDASAMGPLHQQRAAISARLADLLGDDAVILLPTMPGVAPFCGSSAAVMDSFRRRALGLLSPAGLAGLPQITMPLARLPTGPLGLSVMGPRGSDLALLALVSRLCAVHCAPR